MLMPCFCMKGKGVREITFMPNGNYPFLSMSYLPVTAMTRKGACQQILVIFMIIQTWDLLAG